MSKRPEIPERVSSLMPAARKDALNNHQQRSVSATSQLFQASVDSNVSEYLEASVTAMQSELDWIRCFRDGLDEARAKSLLSDTEFEEQIRPFINAFRSTSTSLNVWKRHRRSVEDEREEDLQKLRIKKRRTEAPDSSFLDRAYASAIVSRVMAASAKQKGKSFNRSEFRARVSRFYGIDDFIVDNPDHAGLSWCHVFGSWEDSIKTAHLVPKSLSINELSYLFGEEETVLSNPRNGKSATCISSDNEEKLLTSLF